jgi:preprotein translocase subunit SecB
MTTATTTQATTPPAPTLNIDGFRFEELRIAPLADDAEGPSKDGPPVHIHYDLFSHPDDRQRFAVALRIVAWIDSAETSDAPSAKHEVRISAVGFLTSSEELPDELPVTLAVNGLALLYGIIRGVVTTAASWFGASTLLPTVNFSRMLKDRMRDQAASEASQTPTRKRRRKLPAVTVAAK